MTSTPNRSQQIRRAPAQCRRDAAQRVKAYFAAALFYFRNVRLAQVRFGGKINLSPAAFQPKLSDFLSETNAYIFGHRPDIPLKL